MTTPMLLRLAISVLLVLIQFLAALPWLAVLDPPGSKSWLRRPASWLYAAGGVLIGGVVFEMILSFMRANDWAQTLGRAYGSVLHLQLFADLLVGIFAVLLQVWPKAAAVALAAFREGVRQPMCWLLTCLGLGGVIISLFLPYFTFGQDELMYKEIGFDVAMLVALVFGVLAASMSIHEEIEGRTAITLMSKPVSRRQFLLGKYVGILLAALVITAILGWVFNWTMFYKRWYEHVDPVPPPETLTAFLNALLPSGTAPEFYRGIGLWLVELGDLLPGLVLGFCQVMVLLSVAVALATRLPMVVNLPICLLIYFLAHLSPVLVQVSQRRLERAPTGSTVDTMVNFVAQLFDTILPGLQFFTLGPSVISDTPLSLPDLAGYVGMVLGYGVLYTVIVLLFGLILFEDRDLA